jgi:hypothetical protein
MATTASISTNSFLDGVLPQFGGNRVNTPIWDESQMMFLTNQYRSNAGHLYYLGVRFCDRFVTILHICKWNNWTYINETEVYAFNGTERELIGNKRYEKEYYDEAMVRSDTETIISNYLKGALLSSGNALSQDKIEETAKGLVASSYRSLLKDNNPKWDLEAIKPLLTEKLNQYKN